jgi:hypothetical protein
MSFHTKYTKDDIPDGPGIYAWFLPLAETSNRKGLVELLKESANFRRFDSRTKKAAKLDRQGKINAWDTLRVTVEHLAGIDESGAMKKNAKKWDDLRGEPEWDPFREALMFATIFSSPLYVGMTKTLAKRYGEHLNGGGQFAGKYQAWRERDDVKGSFPLQDLVFVCIRLSESAGQLLEQEQEGPGEELSLLEFAVMRAVRPTFSEK